jgi:hypothetical protein
VESFFFFASEKKGIPMHETSDSPFCIVVFLFGLALLYVYPTFVVFGRKVMKKTKTKKELFTLFIHSVAYLLEVVDCILVDLMWLGRVASALLEVECFFE